MIYHVEKSQHFFRLPFGELNIHSFNGKLIRHKTEVVGSTTQVTIQLAIAQGTLHSIVRLFYDGQEIPPANYKFYKGTSGEIAADAFFPRDVNHPNASFINFRLPQGMAVDNKPERAVARIKCLEVEDYNAAGVQTGFGYSDNPARCLAYGCKVFPGVGVNVLDWAAWHDYKQWCDERITSYPEGIATQTPRFRFNYFFEPGTTFKEFIDRITISTCSSWQWRGGKIRIIPGKIQNVDATFDLTKLAQDYKFQPVKNSDRPNGVLVRWRDLATKFLEPAEPFIVKRDDLIQADGVENFREFDYKNAYHDQIERFAHYQARIWCDSLDFCAIKASFTGYPILPNDIVNVTHTTPGWTNKRCRVVKKEEREDRRSSRPGIESSDTGYKLFLRVEPVHPYSDTNRRFVLKRRADAPNPYKPPPAPKANLNLIQQTQTWFDKVQTKNILGRVDFQDFGFQQRARISVAYPSKTNAQDPSQTIFERLTEVHPDVNNRGEFIINDVEVGWHTVRAATISSWFGQENTTNPVEESININKMAFTVDGMNGYSAVRRGLIGLNPSGQFTGRDGAVISASNIRARIANQQITDHGQGVNVQIHVWVNDLGFNKHNNSDTISAVEVDAFDQFGNVLVDNLPQAATSKTTVITLQHNRDYADALEGQSYYRIRFFNQYGWSNYVYLSGSVVSTSVPTPGNPANYPTDLKCHPIDRFRLDMSVVSSVQMDLYYRKPPDRHWWVLLDRANDFSDLDVSGLTEFEIYEFQARASANHARRSNIVTCRMKQLHNPSAAPIPLTPSGHKNPANPNYGLIFSYISASGSAHTEVWKNNVLDRTETSVQTGVKKEIVYNNLSAGTTVYVKFRHKYTVNLFSTFTAEVSATTDRPKPPVSAPTNLSSTLSSTNISTTVTLNWVNNGGVGPFNVEDSSGGILITSQSAPLTNATLSYTRYSFDYSVFHRVHDAYAGYTGFVESRIPAIDPSTQGWIRGGANNCFVGDTKVMCANWWRWLVYRLNMWFFGEIRHGGMLLNKRISRLREGNWTVSPDKIGKLHRAKITYKFKSLTSHLVSVRFEDSLDVTVVTPNHRFRTSETQFQQIGKLQSGDRILGRTQSGNRIYRRIKSIKHCERKGKQYVVYNLHVPPYLTYIANGCEVHNYKPADPFDPS